jgi:hypothetical protein
VPVLSSVRDEQSINRSRYDGFNIAYRQRLTHRFSLNTNYSLSRAYSYDSTSTSFRNYPRDPRFPLSKFEWGPTLNDERHHITVSGIAELPWGIQFAPILQFGSARPYKVTSPDDTLGFGSGTDNRAVVVPNTGSQTDYLTGAAGQACYFAGTCHLVPFNSLRGDPFFQLDTKLSKNIHLGETRNLELIAQAFNLTNRANYGNDFNNKPGPTLGTPAGFINPTSTNIPRALAGEFGFRFTF